MVDVKWEGKMRFVATREDKHSLIMDTGPDFGGEGEGFTPVELILAGLGGCAGMDVISIMERQRQKVTGLSVAVSGVRRKKPPQYYKSIDVRYIVRGRDINEAAVKRAIKLSEEKYCSVRATFRPEIKITSSYEIEQ